MNIQEINQLTKASVSQLTSEAYKEAFNDPTTGRQFAEKINALENAPQTPTATRPHGNVRGPEPATPASTSFDPSFDDAPAPAAAAPAPAPTQPAAPGNLAVWEYQPADGQGRPVGGLTTIQVRSISAERAPTIVGQPVDQGTLVRNDCVEGKEDSGVHRVCETRGTGYREPALLSTFDHPEAEASMQMTQNAINNGVMSALNLFKQRHPEFVLGEANAVAMLKWVEKSGRNPADGQTWELAWKSLRPYLLDAEVQAAEVPAPAPKAAAPAVRTNTTARVGTGLSNADTFNDEPVVAPATVQGVKLTIDGKTVVMDLRSWDRQSSDFQRRALRNPSNASAIDALYRADDDRKSAVRSGR